MSAAPRLLSAWLRPESPLRPSPGRVGALQTAVSASLFADKLRRRLSADPRVHARTILRTVRECRGADTHLCSAEALLDCWTGCRDECRNNLAAGKRILLSDI